MRFSSYRCLLLRCSWTEEGPQGVVTLGAFGFLWRLLGPYRVSHETKHDIVFPSLGLKDGLLFGVRPS